MNENILDDQQIQNLNLRRRDLLPTWIKIFVWIFLIFGAAIPIILILGAIGMNFSISLYGLQTMNPFSLVGLFLTLLFILKGIVAYGLLTEKEWAVKFAIIDAVIGILVCILVTAILPFLGNNNGMNISFRLELIPLILYLIQMKKIKSEWEKRISLER